jgi:hypothetical protein
MSNRKQVERNSWGSVLLLASGLALGLATHTVAQTEQRVDVTIRDFTSSRLNDL